MKEPPKAPPDLLGLVEQLRLSRVSQPVRTKLRQVLVVGVVLALMYYLYASLPTQHEHPPVDITVPTATEGVAGGAFFVRCRPVPRLRAHEGPRKKDKRGVWRRDSRRGFCAYRGGCLRIGRLGAAPQLTRRQGMFYKKFDASPLQECGAVGLYIFRRRAWPVWSSSTA